MEGDENENNYKNNKWELKDKTISLDVRNMDECETINDKNVSKLKREYECNLKTNTQKTKTLSNKFIRTDNYYVITKWTLKSLMI